jgi:plastocyanin
MIGKYLTAGALGFLAALALPASAANQTVSFDESRTYSPMHVTITAGETVTFSPASGNDFDKAAGPGLTHHPLKFVGDTALPQETDSKPVTRTFAQPGTYTFFCENHGSENKTGMWGDVTVLPASTTTTGTTTSGGTTTTTTTTGTTTTTSTQTQTQTQTTTPGPTAGQGTTTTSVGGADAPKLKLAKLTLAGLGHRAPVIRFTTDKPGRATASLTAKGAVLARATKTIKKAGAQTLTLKITTSGRKRLRAAKKVSAQLKLTLSDGAGHSTTLAKTLTLSR